MEPDDIRYEEQDPLMEISNSAEMFPVGSRQGIDRGTHGFNAYHSGPSHTCQA